MVFAKAKEKPAPHSLPPTPLCPLGDLFFLSRVVSAPCTMMSLPKNVGRRRGLRKGHSLRFLPSQPHAPQGQRWPWLRSSRLLPSGIYDSLFGQSWFAPPEIKQSCGRLRPQCDFIFLPDSSGS